MTGGQVGTGSLGASPTIIGEFAEGDFSEAVLFEMETSEIPRGVSAEHSKTLVGAADMVQVTIMTTGTGRQEQQQEQEFSHALDYIPKDRFSQGYF